MLTSPGNDAECLLLRRPLFTCDEKFGVLGSWALASTAMMSPKSDPDWQELVSANARDKLWEGAKAAAAGFSEALGRGSKPLWTAKCHHKWELSVRKPGCGGAVPPARQGGVKPTLPEHSGRSRRWGRGGEGVEYSFRTRPMVSKSHGHGPEGLLRETIIGGH